jgi:hypothetical protein
MSSKPSIFGTCRQREKKMKQICQIGAMLFALWSAAAAADTDHVAPAALDEREPSSPAVTSMHSIGARGYVTSANALYGGFELRAAASVYFLIRGNSLGSLGVTFGYLDAPRVRIYDSAGRDIAFDVSGRAGFNACSLSNNSAQPVRTYYASRGVPAHDRDACASRSSLAAGVYTFSVTPSIPGVTTTSSLSSPSFGEVLFEVVFNP